MKKGIWSCLAIVIIFIPCQGQNLINAFPNLTFRAPLDLRDPDDGTNRLFVVGEEGLIWVFDNDPNVATKSEFLDIRDRVAIRPDNPGCGLLAMTFHPDFASNGRLFVAYCSGDVLQEDDTSPIISRLSEFRVSDFDANVADPGSEIILLELEQPNPIHNVGGIEFGPDGYLYVGSADGGPASDPGGHGQNPGDLLGALLRLDVDDAAGNLPPDCGTGDNYAVPADNPFVGSSECGEIFAYGLRNPWRFSFDATGRLWVGDTGDSNFEEVNWVTSGKNYGWNTMEGDYCFPPDLANPPPGTCDATGLVLPMYTYDHSAPGAVALIGGFVYDGPGCSAFQGQYLYADAGQNDIWALPFDGISIDGEGATEIINAYNDPEDLDGTLFESLVAFGKDHTGQVYVMEHVWGVCDCDRDRGKILIFDCANE